MRRAAAAGAMLAALAVVRYDDMPEMVWYVLEALA